MIGAFSVDPECLKCGHRDVEMVFREADLDCGIPGDCLRVVCVKCDFTWDMETKDARLRTTP